MGLRAGIDLVEVAAVADAVDRHARRYLSRVYTEAELAACRSQGGYQASRLAQRFAAKEAALKALRPAGEAVAWRDIALQETPAGLRLRLTGAARGLARRAGLDEWSVSVSCAMGYACAVIIARGAE